MSYYVELTTLADIHTYVGSTANAEDTLYLDLIRSVSREMEAYSGQKLAPMVETRLYPVPGRSSLYRASSLYGVDYEFYDNRKGGWPSGGNYLRFDAPLLALTTLLNGDGTAITSASYYLEPANSYPKMYLTLKPTSGVAWLPTAAGETQQAISVTGIFGWHEDYANAWRDTLAVLAAAISSTTATTFTATTGLLRAGDLVQIDSEFLYVSAVAVGATDTITCVRGVNGSTAATHVISSLIYRWYTPELEFICRTGVVAYQRLKNNPLGDTVRIGDATFTTPKDVGRWLSQRIAALGATRETSFA